MWFVYVQGHGISESFNVDELDREVRGWLETHKSETITVIEGEDITSAVLSNLKDNE